jgi:predicted Co/Zn/Cd cation transporter (cation efflux family)
MMPYIGRGFSTLHALVAAAVSFYLVMISDLFNEDAHNSIIIIDRKSWLSDSMFGVSCAFQLYFSLRLKTIDLLSIYTACLSE